MLDELLEEAPQEQHRSYFTEDFDHELKSSNRTLQRAKRRLRDANLALQQLFEDLRASSDALERQNLEVESARRSLANATREKLTRPTALSYFSPVMDLRQEMEDHVSPAEAEKTLRAQRVADAQACLDRVLAQQALAAAAQSALQMQLPAVNRVIQTANDDVQRAFKCVHKAARYEMMLARQDCSEIAGAFEALLGRTPGQHWRTDEEQQLERRRRELEEAAALASAAATHSSEEERVSVRRSRCTSSKRSALESAAVRPPAVPPLALPFVTPAPKSQEAQTDRPWPQRGPSSIGQGLTPRLLCRGGLSGGQVTLNKPPQAAQSPVSSVVTLPALPTARRAPAALGHQPTPRSLNQW
jgi:hypothetical protein